MKARRNPTPLGEEPLEIRHQLSGFIVHDLAILDGYAMQDLVELGRLVSGCSSFIGSCLFSQPEVEIVRQRVLLRILFVRLFCELEWRQGALEVRR